MIGRIISTLSLGLCLSACGGGLIALFAALTNLPRILTGLATIARSILRVSYHLYAWLLKLSRNWVYRVMGIDLLKPYPRIAASIAFSGGMGWALLFSLNWQITWWWLATFALHGLLIGHAWESIAQPGTLQLGEQWP